MDRWGTWVVVIITFLIVTSGIYFPTYFNYDYYFGLILIMITLLGILASFSMGFISFRKVTRIIIALAVIVNFLWFHFLEYSFELYLIYFFICNLCFIFVYAFLFTLMPYYANKYQEKYEQSSVRGYHIHENTYGIVLVSLGILGFFTFGQWRTNIELLDFLKYHFFLYFGTAMIIVGAFLIGRDYKDIKRLKFIESMEKRILDPNFNIRKRFYQIGKAGIILTLFGIIFFFQNRLWGALFINRAFFMIFGLTLIIVGAILGGLNSTYFANRSQQ